MSDKHTPGPWLIASTDACFIYALNSRSYNRFWAQVSGGGIIPGEQTTQMELEANARLIASAPDLLAALQGLLSCVSVRIDDPRIAAFDAARAAIAKATGPEGGAA